jgi:hypothetical protein
LHQAFKFVTLVFLIVGILSVFFKYLLKAHKDHSIHYGKWALFWCRVSASPSPRLRLCKIVKKGEEWFEKVRTEKNYSGDFLYFGKTRLIPLKYNSKWDNYANQI